jgi:hypothetical protein
MDFLDKHFHPLLSAFRPGFGCQTALLKIIDDWKKALDDNKFIAAILMDFSYGLSKNSLKLLQSYLENRKQRIKIGSYYSDWDQMCKGVPQRSILGPVLFKIFINDIFLFVQNSTIYNYADDNTVSYCEYDIHKVVNTLEVDSLKLVNWFSINLMKANPDKFQAIAIGKKNNII